MKFSKEECEQWKREPLYNPAAHQRRRALDVNGPTYKRLVQECAKYGIAAPRAGKAVEVEVEGAAAEPEVVAAAPQPRERKLTKAECRTLEKTKVNPITKRVLKPDNVQGLYRKLMKQCLVDFGDLQDTPQGANSMPLEAKRFRLKRALKRALDPLLNPKDSTENRLKFHKAVQKHFDNLQPCIVSRTVTTGADKWVMIRAASAPDANQEVLLFDKRIGSKSVYGVAYMNMGKGFQRMLKLSAKVVPGDPRATAAEIGFLLNMTKVVFDQLSPNMPITYHIYNCNAAKLLQHVKDPNLPKMLKQPYTVVLSELADGDLHEFFKHKHTPEEYESVIFQVLLALRAFHIHVHAVHKDAHLGNFLFHRVKKGGYWHYKIKGQDYFVPNAGYLVVLWDPGLASYYNSNTPHWRYSLNNDNYRPLALMRKFNTDPYYHRLKLISVPPKTFRVFSDIFHILLNDLENVNLWEEIATRIRAKKLKFDHILTDKTDTMTVINKRIYQLG